jgi:hypothetical protein
VKPFLYFSVCRIATLSFAAAGVAQQAEEHMHAPLRSEEGLGHAHMEISCSPALAAEFDRALALLHNFWYARALQGFHQVAKDDPECAMAYWGAAMTYNHPLWDAPSTADEAAAWTLVQKGLARKKHLPERSFISLQSPRSSRMPGLGRSGMLDTV